LFVFILANTLHVALRNTAYDYPFRRFKPFIVWSAQQYQE